MRDGMERWPVEAQPVVRHVGVLIPQHLFCDTDHSLKQRLVLGRQRLGVTNVFSRHHQEVVLGSRLYVSKHDQVIGGDDQLRAAWVISANFTEYTVVGGIIRHGVG